MLTLGDGILADTFAALRSCGGGERECVAYWLGPIDQPGCVDRVLQPPHDASPRHYEVDGAWVTDLFLDLRSTRSCVRAQVHTHPGPHVEHSPTDDTFALAPSPGFTSVVLPYFATGPVTLDGSYVAVVTESGWRPVTHADAIRWT